MYFQSLIRNLAWLGASLTLFGCDSDAPEQGLEPLLRPVRTVQVEPSVTGPFKEFTAVVDAFQKADLAFRVSGNLVELPVKSGDLVAQGQLIARLDDADIQVQLKEAQSSYEIALSDYGRAQKLIGNNSISYSDFDQFKAKYNSAYAQLQSVKNKLAYTRLHASFDGVIAQRYVENFQEVNAQTPIVALHDLEQISFKVDIPESVLINVKPGETPPKVTASFESIPDAEFSLTFKEISTQADEITKTYQVVFTMPGSTDYTILPGMSARVRVSRPDSAEPLANFYLPAHAVLKDTQGNYVFTVSQTEPGQGRIARQNITVGNITSLGLEVFAGLQAGQHVITAGMSKVADGVIVKFQE